MEVYLIGAGNLATHLGKALAEAGHTVVGVYSRTVLSAETLATALHCEATTSLDNVSGGADVYVIAVKDAVLTEVAVKLAKRFPESLLVHTAGSMPMDTIPAARRGVLYPMQTFSRNRAVDFRRIPCFVEASSQEDRGLLLDLASSMSELVYEADGEQRKYLHLSAVFCCNFVNHCYTLAEKLLTEHGELPFDTMLPLIDETARKIHELMPHEAQTGPAVRWDTNVIEKQKQLLADTPELQNIYEVMSESIHAAVTAV